jgi:hypothetical protein
MAWEYLWLASPPGEGAGCASRRRRFGFASANLRPSRPAIARIRSDRPELALALLAHLDRPHPWRSTTTGAGSPFVPHQHHDQRRHGDESGRNGDGVDPRHWSSLAMPPRPPGDEVWGSLFGLGLQEGTPTAKSAVRSTKGPVLGPTTRAPPRTAISGRAANGARPTASELQNSTPVDR